MHGSLGSHTIRSGTQHHVFCEGFAGAGIDHRPISRAKQRYARITVALQNDTPVEAPWANPIVCDTPISEKKFRRYFSAIQSFDVEGWKAQYGDASEGDSWSFRIEMKDGYVIHSQGCGDYPAEWFELVYLYDQLCPFWRCFATRRRAMPIGIVAG